MSIPNLFLTKHHRAQALSVQNLAFSATHQRPHQPSHQLPAKLVGRLAQGAFHRAAEQIAGHLAQTRLLRCGPGLRTRLCGCLGGRLAGAGGKQFVGRLAVDGLVIAPGKRDVYKRQPANCVPSIACC